LADAMTDDLASAQPAAFSGISVSRSSQQACPSSLLTGEGEAKSSPLPLRSNICRVSLSAVLD
jgi:hypothetical protein